MKRIWLVLLLFSAAHSGELRITVYNRAHLNRTITNEAFDQLRRIFRQARIEIHLVKGDLQATDGLTFHYVRTPAEGHEAEAVCQARQDISLEITSGTPNGLRPRTLGMSIPLTRDGLNVMIFDQRVAEFAQRGNTSHGAVLGFAMAHEIGHVLLRNGAHVSYGLMSAAWNRFELDQIGAGILFFLTDQSAAMRANLERCQPQIEGTSRESPGQ